MNEELLRVVEEQREDTPETADEEKASVSTQEAQKIFVPGNILSFADLKAWQESRETTRKLRELASALEQITFNVIYDQFIENKPQALVALAREFEKEVTSLVSEGVNNLNKAEDEAAPSSGFFMQKQADGSFRWLAIWSANTEDEDFPPDIISKDAFLDYIDRLNKGVEPFPELWLYHIEGTKWGQTDFVSFAPVEGSGIGFAIASGTVDKGKESIAESFLPENTKDEAEIGVSHGMRDVVRKKIDGKNVITKFTTYEISPLYLKEAAHKLTGFTVS